MFSFSLGNRLLTPGNDRSLTLRYSSCAVASVYFVPADISGHRRRFNFSCAALLSPLHQRRRPRSQPDGNANYVFSQSGRRTYLTASSLRAQKRHQRALTIKAGNTIKDAEDSIRRRFAANGFHGRLEYEPGKVIETGRWWYIPFCWIGCVGFIVKKDDLYVNWLGSGVGLEQCFWGHDHGVYCDLVDFTFSPEIDTSLAARLISRFKHMHPNPGGAPPNEPVWYRESEIPAAISTQFPTFRRHQVWNGIPELFHAFEKEGLRFTCCLSK